MRKLRMKIWVLDGKPSDPAFRDMVVGDEGSLEDIAAHMKHHIEEAWGYKGARPMVEDIEPPRPVRRGVREEG